jgi:hypothetical protein
LESPPIFPPLSQLFSAVIRVTHLKGTVKAKNYLVTRNDTFLVEPLRYQDPYQCRSFSGYGVSMLLHQSPIRIKVGGEALDP